MYREESTKRQTAPVSETRFLLPWKYAGVRKENNKKPAALARQNITPELITAPVSLVTRATALLSNIFRS
ncbi:MAG: hypothetical protein ACLSG9_07735 [Eubacterium sp.]